MSELTDVVEGWEEAKEYTFFGKPVDEMSREELLCLIKWQADELDKAEQQRYDAEMSKAELMKDLA